MNETSYEGKRWVYPVLIGGSWQEASFSETFQAYNPATAEKLPDLSLSLAGKT
jgi:hypothetical protein